MIASTGPVERACVGKRKHETRKSAKIDAKNQKRYGHKQAGRTLQTYICRYCGFYHVGHGGRT